VPTPAAHAVAEPTVHPPLRRRGAQPAAGLFPLVPSSGFPLFRRQGRGIEIAWVQQATAHAIPP